MKYHNLHPNDTSIMAILDSGAFSRQQRLKRCQRRSRVAIRFVLFALLVALVVFANALSLSRPSSLEWSTRGRIHYPPIQRHKRTISLSQSQPEDRYRREISVWDYEDVQEYYKQIKQEQEATRISSHKQNKDWTEEQLEEMERYYRRYLQVFAEAHGDQYQPESKEVVYAEYLKFLEEKAKAKAAKARASQSKEMLSKEEVSMKEVDEEDPAELPRNESMKIYDPIYVESDWEQFNELGGDLLKQSNNSNFVETVRSTRTIATTRV